MLPSSVPEPAIIQPPPTTIIMDQSIGNSSLSVATYTTLS